MIFIIGAKITSIEFINNPLEIEADSAEQAIEKAELINANDSDQIHHQKMLLDECTTEFFIKPDEPAQTATFKDCPYCFAEWRGYITGMDYITSMVQRDNRISQTIKCPACDKKWVDVYTLSSRENGHAETIQFF